MTGNASPSATARPVLRERLIVPVLAFGGVLMALMQTVVVPLLPELPHLTGTSPANVSWMVTATLLTGAVCTPVLGRAGDMYGKRRMLLAALAAMTTGSLMCALSSDIRVLVAARALQGASAAVVPLATSILRDELPPERVGSAAALMSSTVGVGAAFGLPLTGVMVQYTDWHAMFWVCAALGALGLAGAWWTVPESPVRTPGRFDVAGAAGLSAALVCVLLAVSKGNDWGWDGPVVIGLFAAGAVILAVWARHQGRVRDPLVDLTLARRPAVLLPHVAALLIGFSFYANSLSTAQLVQVPASSGYGLGASVVVAGLCLLPSGVSMMVISPLSARLSRARGAKVTLALGAGVIAGGYVLRLFTSEHLATVIVGSTIVSMGTSLAYSALPMLVIRATPQEQTAAATGLNVLMRTIGQAVCSAVVAAVLAAWTVRAGERIVPDLHAFLVVFGIAGAGALLAVVAALCVPGLSGGPERAGEGRAVPVPQESGGVRGG